MNNPFSMEGQVALVTGGDSGLGFGVAQRFVEAGAYVNGVFLPVDAGAAGAF